MECVQLWFKVCIMGYVFSECLAINCNWKTQYAYNEKCCDACPAGTYPKQFCSSQCMNCTTSNHWCRCGNKPLCKNKDCSNCVTRPDCKPGQVINRTGFFDFTYVCGDCPENMFSDEEKNICTPFQNCKQLDLDVLFAGNRTHNAHCGPLPPLNCNHWTLESLVIIVCLASSVAICLALLVNAYIQRSKNRRKRTKHCSATHSFVMPSDECGWKLSKEEKGDDCDLHSDVSGDSELKCEV